MLHLFSRPERLGAIGSRFNLDENETLVNVLSARPYTTDNQFALLEVVAAHFHQEKGVFKLLIIDSMMSLFRVDFTGRGQLADR